jgi:hypothetical protein
MQSEAASKSRYLGLYIPKGKRVLLATTTIVGCHQPQSALHQACSAVMACWWLSNQGPRNFEVDRLPFFGKRSFGELCGPNHA